MGQDPLGLRCGFEVVGPRLSLSYEAMAFNPQTVSQQTVSAISTFFVEAFSNNLWCAPSATRARFEQHGLRQLSRTRRGNPCAGGRTRPRSTSQPTAHSAMR